jgi:hypothetical protein
MGRPHSKAEKSSTVSCDEKTPTSPRQKRDKLKKDHEKRNKKKFGFSKKKSKLEGLKVSQLPMVPPLPRSSLTETELEIEIKRRMQDQLAFNSDIFVLNQMMMSVQFFANYERYKQSRSCVGNIIFSGSDQSKLSPPFPLFSFLKSLKFTFYFVIATIKHVPLLFPSTVPYRLSNTKRMPLDIYE